MKIKLFKFSIIYDSRSDIQDTIDKWTNGKEIIKVSTKLTESVIVMTILYNEAI
jgi:hypothetical protein